MRRSLLLVLPVFGGFLLAQEPEFAELRLAEGKTAFREQRIEPAIEDFRLASFGFLENPARLSETLARLALAQSAARRAEEARATVARFLDLETQFGAYSSEALEPDLRAAFHALLLRTVPREDILSLAGLSRALGLEGRRARRSVHSRAVAPSAARPSPPPTSTVRPVPPAATPTLVAPTLIPSTPTAPSTPTLVPPTATRVPPTSTRTATATPTATRTPTRVAPTATRVPPTAAPTPTTTDAPTRVPPTATLVPPTSTRTATEAPTPVPPTATAVPPTATRTVPPPTMTATRRPPSATPIATPVPTAEPSPTRRPSQRPIVPGDRLDQPPRVVDRVPPVYPPAALKARVRGRVALRVLVGERGDPEEIRVLEGARSDLTEAAVAAVRQWRFEPGLRGESPVRAWLDVTIPFEAIPFASPTPTRSPTRDEPPSIEERGRAPEVPDPVSPEPTSPRGRPAITVYRALRGVRLAISPEQARITLDGKYVGIADDWDGRGGGAVLPLSGKGAHRIHAELPGYEAVDIEVDVTSAAEEEIVDVEEDLERTSNQAYVRLPAVEARTSSVVEFRVDPPDASVSVQGRILGAAASFGVSRPLELSGPAVHELVLSAPGRRPRSIRILAAPGSAERPAVISLRPDTPTLTALPVTGGGSGRGRETPGGAGGRRPAADNSKRRVSPALMPVEKRTSASERLASRSVARTSSRTRTDPPGSRPSAAPSTRKSTRLEVAVTFWAVRYRRPPAPSSKRSTRTSGSDATA